MAEFEINKMTLMQMDVLKEIANIGAGNATTALSTMLNTAVNMSIPQIKLLEFQELADVIGGAENVVVGILLTLQQSIDGMMMFILEKDTAYKVVNRLMGRPADDTGEFSDMDISALSELGNIIAGSYLSSISSFTNMPISASKPN